MADHNHAFGDSYGFFPFSGIFDDQAMAVHVPENRRPHFLFHKHCRSAVDLYRMDRRSLRIHRTSRTGTACADLEDRLVRVFVFNGFVKGSDHCIPFRDIGRVV